MKKMIMIMIDGFGVPECGWDNSIYSKYCSKEFIDLFAEFSINIDATLGIEGIPQSATGQTALFTGINAPKVVNSHISGFPGPSLRELIKKQNIFNALRERDLSVVFANAYVKHSLEELKNMRFRSVTTVMTELALEKVQNRDDLLEGNAIYHDITRESLISNCGIPKISPETAASHLAKIAEKHDFTLFEYFLTDRAGHKMNEERLGVILEEFSRFFTALVSVLGDDVTLLLSSDHGNCEDITIKQHTLNPVPFFVYGLPSIKDSNISSIDQIYDYILRYFTKRAK